MNNDYEKIKADLLAFGKKNGACVGQYQRLYKAESLEDVMTVVRDNFSWCATYLDFSDVIVDNREQFAKYQIWCNQDVEIIEGVGYLLVTEGEINVESYGDSMLNAKSYGASTINAKSRGASTINVKSCDISMINVNSWGTSTINAESYGASTINAKSHDTSTINAKSHDTSTINAKSYDTSTINVTSCRTSTINAESYGASTINAESYGASTINVTSFGASTINVTSFGASMINAEGRNYSTLILKTPIGKYEVNGHSLARLLYANRIVVADDSINVEVQKK